MALAVYIPFPEDDSNSTNHDLVSTLCNQFLYLVSATHTLLHIVTISTNNVNFLLSS